MFVVVDGRIIIDIPFPVKLARLGVEFAVVSHLEEKGERSVSLAERMVSSANLDLVWWIPIRPFGRGFEDQIDELPGT